jgi:hypothetical protein
MNLKNWPITYWLIAVLLVAFIAQLAGLLPVEDFALWPNKVLQGETVWGIFTSMFMHSGIFHFFFNGFALYMFGLFLERQIGSKNLLKLFLLAGVAGSLVHIGFSAATGWAFEIPALGASGAIFGILGALIVLRPDIKVITIPIPVPLPLWQAVLMFTIFMIIFAPFIAHDVHMAGLAVGLAFGFWFRNQIKKDADYTWRAVYNTPTVEDPYDWIDNYR